SIVLQFSKRVTPSLTNDWRRWIQLEPSVSNLTAEIEDKGLTLQGDFNSGTCYRLAVKTGLPAGESFTLADGALTNIVMPGIPPRLYFSAFAEDQQAVGRRQITATRSGHFRLSRLRKLLPLLARLSPPRGELPAGGLQFVRRSNRL